MEIDVNMFDPYFHALSNGLQRKILKEMASDLWKAKAILTQQRPTIQEHFVKAFLLENTTKDLNGWIRTIANSLSICNHTFIKPKNKKFSKSEYLDMAFGINETFSESDATIILYDAVNQLSPKFTMNNLDDLISNESVERFYILYWKFSNYFAEIFSKDKSPNTDDVGEFKDWVLSLIKSK